MPKRLLNIIILLITTLAFGYLVVCPADYTDTVAQAQSGPDLTVSLITSSPATPAIGDKVTFTVTLRNQGTVTSGYFYVAYYLDNDYFTNDYVTPIGPGASAEHTFTWTAKAGIHTVRAVADYRQQVNESDEGNNAKTYTFSTLGPDLIIDSITWSPPEPSVGTTVTFTTTIKNLGTLVANPSRVNFYIDGVSRGYKEVSRINPGEAVTRTFSWFAKPGSHEVKAIVDGINAVPEIDEANNEKTLLFSTRLPDLIIDEITWFPAEPSIGDNVSFTVTVANQGNGISGNSTVHFYVSENYLDSEQVGGLDPGAAENVTFTWLVGYAARSIKAVVFSGGIAIESDDTNNEKTYTLFPALSDLLIQGITWSPDNPDAGDNVTFSISVKNQGIGNSIASRVDLFIDNEDIGYRGLGPIDASSTKTVTFSWLAKGGVHKIRAIVDLKSKVPESDETNNEKVITFPPLPPDLIIDKITWAPPEPAIGDTVTITVTVRNQGEAISDYAYIVYYIDNVQLTTGRVNPVSHNATDNQTFIWTLTPGEHVIKAFVDFTNIVDESDETNNEGVTTLAPSGPDLIIESLDWSLNNPQAGEVITFTVTVKNNGNVMSSASLVHLYVDNSSRGYQDIPKLEPGVKETRTFDWKFAPGLYEIRAVTDGPNLVVERNEENNEMLIAYPIPDLTLEALTWSPIEPAIGGKITLTAYVKNKGSLDAEGSQLYFYVDDNLEDYREIPPLDAGASVIETFAWQAAAGPHVLTVLADGANAITEGEEDNNAEVANFSIPAPDLIIESVNWSTGEPATGDTVAFTVIIRNKGDAEARYAYVNYYIDGEFLSSGQIKSLKPNAKTEEPFSTWVSQTGPHTIRIVIDEENEVLESDETNNEELVTFSTESVTPPANTKKPEPQPASPAPTPFTPRERDFMIEIFFGVVILVFTAALVFSVLREFRRRSE